MTTVPTEIDEDDEHPKAPVGDGDALLQEGLELLAEYRRIKDPQRRREIMNLVKIAAETG